MEFKEASKFEVYRFLGLYVRSSEISVSEGLRAEINNFSSPRSAMIPKGWRKPHSVHVACVYSMQRVLKKYRGDTYTVMFRGRRVATIAGNDQHQYDEVVVTGKPDRLIVWRSGMSARELGRIQHLADREGIAIEYR